MLCLSEEIVREVSFDLVEVVSERSKRLVVRFGEEQVEFRSVELEAIDLAVLKFKSPDDGIGGKESCAGAAESMVCAEWSVGLEPVLERSRGNLDMGSSPGYALGVGKGVAEIERGDCVEDDSERVCSMLVGSAGEAVQAFRAFV